MGKFLEAFKLPKLKQEEIENLNRVVTSKEIESVIKTVPTNKSPGLDSFTDEFYQMFEENLIPITELFQKIEEKGKLLNSLNKASITLIQ